jgi:hypothetical protein
VTNPATRSTSRRAARPADIPKQTRGEITRDGLASCHYCAAPMAEEIDHVVPRTRGGADDSVNLVPACTRCNQEKGSFTADEWREYRISVGDPWPPLPRDEEIRMRIRKIAERVGAQHGNSADDIEEAIRLTQQAYGVREANR